MKEIIETMMNIKGFRKHCMIGTLLILYVCLLQVFKIYSPITYLFGVPTPTTGTTRAWIEFVKGDFASAMEKHPLFLFAIPYALSLYSVFINKKRTWFIIALAFTILYLVVYIMRIYNQTIYF